MIGKEIAHYRILDRLGGGGMGVVYKAEDIRLGRTVALKFLNLELLSNESTRKRFLHEARAASLIDHANVCHVYEVGETEDGRAFLAMSYCEGRSLREVIDGGPVPAREAFSIAFRVAQGLWAAHRRGIIHRDIKPANILLSSDGDVRIVDFGLALLIGHSRVTTSGVTVGTVAYMSPEQTSDSAVGPNTDIWSLGVTLYEMITAKLPFRGEINAALVYSIVHEPHTPLLKTNSSAPSECARIIDRCLEKDPAKRYQAIEELLEDMVDVARKLGWESSIASSTIAPILSDRRRRILMRRVAAATAVVAVVAGGLLAWNKWRPEPSPYTTEIRLAVLPLQNMIGTENQELVDGLSEHLSRVVRWEARGHDSMWTVPYTSVLSTDLADANNADDAFGANRVLTGDVQRFGDSFRINLDFRDPQAGRSLGRMAVPFNETGLHILLDTLAVSAAALLDLNENPAASPWKCMNPVAARAYLESMPQLKKADLERVVPALDRAIDLDPSFAGAVCAAGSARLALFRRTKDAAVLAAALDLGRSAFSLAPRFTEACTLVGDVYVRMNQPDSAEAWYRRGVMSEPGNLVASQKLANLYGDRQRIDEARDVYLRAIAVHPDLYRGHRDFGNFYFEHEQIDSAAAEYRIALTMAPGDAMSLNNLGAVHHRQGQWAEARALFLRAFQVRPDCESSSNLAVTLYFEKKFDEAAKYYEFALEHCDTTTHLPWGDLARALYWAPDGRDRAIFYYRKALAKARREFEGRQDDLDLMAFVIDYEAMTGNESETRRLIDQIKPLLKDDAGAMYRVGAICEKLGQREAALDLIGNAIRHGFPVPEIRGDPMLSELITDPVFLAMVRNEEAAEEARAAGSP